MNLDRYLLTKKPRLLFATGAGLSKESGINTFRDSIDGTWETFDVDEVCNIAKFRVNYDAVHKFYNSRRAALKDVEPNLAHYFIAEMEELYGEDRVLHITANVDDLSERAGNQAMHVHGNLLEVVEPYSFTDYAVKNIGYNEHIPTDGVVSKPNVVMFGEATRFVNNRRIGIYDEMYTVLDSLRKHDIVVVIGSSDTVIMWSVIAGLGTPATVINVNPEVHDGDHCFTYNLYKPATHAIEELRDFINKGM